jgi:hypothetical protein
VKASGHNKLPHCVSPRCRRGNCHPYHCVLILDFHMLCKSSAGARIHRRWHWCQDRDRLVLKGTVLGWSSQARADFIHAGARDKWCRGWGSNPDGPKAQGSLRRDGEGNEISKLLTRCPFPFPRVTGSDRTVRGLWTPRWTPVRRASLFRSNGLICDRQGLLNSQVRRSRVISMCQLSPRKVGVGARLRNTV